MKKSYMKSMLIDMFRKNQDTRWTKNNRYDIKYMKTTDEYRIGRMSEDDQILGSIVYTQAEFFPASEIERLAKK